MAPAIACRPPSSPALTTKRRCGPRPSKLTGNYPTLAEIGRVRDAAESSRAGEYEKLLDEYMARPSFGAQILSFFRDTYKMGGSDMRWHAGELRVRPRLLPLASS